MGQVTHVGNTRDSVLPCQTAPVLTQGREHTHYNVCILNQYIQFMQYTK
jgi:hypothetical protein